MTPEDRATARGRSQAGEAPVPVSPPSPQHRGPSCPYCTNLSRRFEAARKAYNYSALVDLRILTRRHLNQPRQSQQGAA